LLAGPAFRWSFAGARVALSPACTPYKLVRIANRRTEEASAVRQMPKREDSTRDTSGASADWLARFPLLGGITGEERAALLRAVAPLSLPPETTVFRPGEACGAFIFVTSGRVRVLQLDRDGNEIVLYRLGPGSICILTTMALLAADTYNAFGVTETRVEAIALPERAFDDLLGRSAGFRNFVFHAHAERMADLMRVIQTVTFESIEQRLASRLLVLAAEGREIAITHQRLAAEIGTAREVVSRHLKAFERRGWVALGRGVVELRNAGSLRHAAHTRD
jgi:CRP/FNR family transcriptional regulator